MKHFALLFFAAITLNTSAEDNPWISLFDGKSLTGWQATSEANWRVEDGAIVVDAGKKGFLLHEDAYFNYELQIDFKAAPGTNSGVFLSTQPSPKKLTEDCYELNIAPPDNPFPTGSLVARKKVEGVGESEEWRTYQIRVEGAHVAVSLAGEQILDYQGEAPSTGNRIGLQLNEGRVAFRNIRIRRL
tara:strand:+ start:508 stop:1068 length:561 start_codon:yes stop_codon:yes gene_type:complete